MQRQRRQANLQKQRPPNLFAPQFFKQQTRQQDLTRTLTHAHASHWTLLRRCTLRGFSITHTARTTTAFSLLPLTITGSTLPLLVLRLRRCRLHCITRARMPAPALAPATTHCLRCLWVTHSLTHNAIYSLRSPPCRLCNTAAPPPALPGQDATFTRFLPLPALLHAPHLPYRAPHCLLPPRLWTTYPTLHLGPHAHLRAHARTHHTAHTV